VSLREWWGWVLHYYLKEASSWSDDDSWDNRIRMHDEQDAGMMM